MKNILRIIGIAFVVAGSLTALAGLVSWFVFFISEHFSTVDGALVMLFTLFFTIAILAGIVDKRNSKSKP